MEISESKFPTPVFAAQVPAGIRTDPAPSPRFLPLLPELSGLVLGYLAPDSCIGARFAQDFPSVEGEADRAAAVESIRQAAQRTPRPSLSEVMKTVHPVLHDCAMYVTALDAGFAIADISPDAVPSLSVEALKSGNRAWFMKLADLCVIPEPEARKKALAIAAATVVEHLKNVKDKDAQALLAGILHSFGWTGMHTALEEAGLPASKFP